MPNDSKELQHAQRRSRRQRLLLERYRQAFAVQSALLRLADLASSVPSMRDFYPAVHEVVNQHLHAVNFYVASVDLTTERYRVEYFADEKDGEFSESISSDLLSGGLTGYVVRTGKPLLCGPQEYEQLANAGEIGRHGTMSHEWMGVPLRRADRVIGVMVVQTYDAGFHYTEPDQQLFEQIAEHTVIAIDRVRQRELLEATVQQRTAALQDTNESLQREIRDRIEAQELQVALYRISELAADSADTSEFYEAIQGVLGGLMHSENCYIALLSEDRTLLTFPFYRDQYSLPAFTKPLGRGLSEYVIRTGETTLIDEDRAEVLTELGEIRASDYNSLLKGHQATSWLGSPLIVENEVMGVIVVQSYDGYYVYGQREKEILHFVSQHIAVAIQRRLAAEQQRLHHDELERRIVESTQELREMNASLMREVEQRKKAEERLYFEANHDALTGLANRQNFLQQLTQQFAMRRRKKAGMALLFLDIDRFKEINDTHGHHIGDDLLCEVSSRLLAVVRDHDVVARLGGDEFVVLLTVLDDDIVAEEVAQRIIVAMSDPVRIKGLVLNTGASIGIAYWHAGYKTSEDLMKNADAAMYQAKGSGRGCYLVYREDVGPSKE
ncbi:diguanylate cyclase [Salinispirillum sp. LH 10-3-1]|uniref:Diguanylate cyclase n=1 Tax=Salinispirillum sp. LH 10-3-1 TaxID=2952525 RepID=A0AB38YJD6_9GAMM